MILFKRYFFVLIIFISLFFSSSGYLTMNDSAIKKPEKEEQDIFAKTLKHVKSILLDIEQYFGKEKNKENRGGFLQSWWENSDRTVKEALEQELKGSNIFIKDIKDLLEKSLKSSPKYQELIMKENLLKFRLISKASSVFDLSFSLDRSSGSSQEKGVDFLGNRYEKDDEFTKIDKSSSVSFYPIKSVQLLPDYLLIYLQYEEIKLQKMELKKKIFNDLAQSIKEIMNKKLYLIKLYLKILNSFNNMRSLVKNRKTISSELFLQENNKAFKYIQHYVDSLEKIYEFSMKIHNLTGQNFSDKNNLLFLKLGDKVSEDKTENYKTLLQESLEEIKKLKTKKDFQLYYETILKHKFAKNIKEQKIANILINLMSIVRLQLSWGLTSTKNKSKKDLTKNYSELSKYKEVSFSTSLSQVVEVLSNMFDSKLNSKKKTLEMKENIINYIIQVKTNLSNLYLEEKNFDFLTKNVNILEREFKESLAKSNAGILAKKESNRVKTKLLCKKISLLISKNSENFYKMCILQETEKF